MRLKELVNSRVHLVRRGSWLIRACPKGQVMEHKEGKSCCGQTTLKCCRRAIYCCSATVSRFYLTTEEDNRLERELRGLLNSSLRNIFINTGMPLRQIIDQIWFADMSSVSTKNHMLSITTLKAKMNRRKMPRS